MFSYDCFCLSYGLLVFLPRFVFVFLLGFHLFLLVYVWFVSPKVYLFSHRVWLFLLELVFSS